MIESIDIHIDTVNDAFRVDNEDELEFILVRLANDIGRGFINDSAILRDSNGNTVGQLTVNYDDGLESK